MLKASMRPGIVHINDWGCQFGGTEIHIKNLAERWPEYDHYLVYQRGSDSAYVQAFAGSLELSRLSATQLREWNTQFVFVHNLPHRHLELAPLRAPAWRFIRFVHDYRVAYMGTGYHRFTMRRHPGALKDYPFPWTLTRDNGRWQLQSRAEKLRILAGLGEYDQIHVATEDLRRTLELNGISARLIRVNPFGLIDVELAGAQKISHQLCFVGNLMRGKGPQLLLHALQSLDVTYSLKIAGDGPLRPALEAFAEKHTMPVEFLGHVDASARAQLLRSSVCMVAPYLMDTYGLTILESMAQETAVVAFREGGPAELVTDGVTGYLAPPADVAALREKIRAALSDPTACHDRGRRAREEVLEKFTFAKYCERLRNFLQNNS